MASQQEETESIISDDETEFVNGAEFEFPLDHNSSWSIDNSPSPIQEFDESTEFIVYGYMRQIQSLLPYDNNPYYNMPPYITNIILLYLQNYFMNEGVYIWKISDQEMINKMLNAENGEKFESDEFIMSKLKWKLEIYPNGNNKELEGYFIIHLYLLSLPSMIENIRFGRIFRIVECMSSAPWTETLKCGEFEYWTKKCPLSELLKINTKTISVYIEINIFSITLKKGNNIKEMSINYPFKSIISRPMGLSLKQRFEYRLDDSTMNIFRSCSVDKVMCSNIINNMWVINLYPRGNPSVNGYNGFTAIYLRLLVWPNNIHCLNAKFRLKCIEQGDTVNYQHQFSFDKSSYGTHAWDKFHDLKKYKTLTFEIQIKICNIQKIDETEIISHQHQVSYLLSSK